LNASDIMTRPVVTVERDTTLEEAARTMLEREIGCVVVVDGEGRAVGIVTEGEFAATERSVPFSLYSAPQLFGDWVPHEGLEALYQRGRTLKAADVMSRPVVHAREADSVQSVAERMLRHRVRHLPVLRDGFPVGMIARHDLLKVMTRAPSGR
jgi:CBS domain-containing protein